MSATSHATSAHIGSASNSTGTGEYLALHRQIEAEDCEALSRQEVSLEVLWQDVQCARHAYELAQETLRKATQRVLTTTDAWMAAMGSNSPPSLSQARPLRSV